jgi:phosphate transport system substrate-binding protein
MIRKTAAGVLLSAGLAATAHAGTVMVHGSSTVASNIMLPHQDAIEQSSGQTLRIMSNGTARGIADLVAGKVHMAMISAPLDTVIAKANKKDPGSVDGSRLQAHPVGATRVAFVVHPSNPAKELSLAQVTDILSGKVKNWQEVGGPNAPIVVVVGAQGGGVRAMVEKELLGGGDIKAAVRQLPGAAQVVKVVKQVPQAFGIAIEATVDAGVTLVKTDQQIEQPLILVTMGSPSAEVTKVIDAAKAVGGS